MYFRFLFALLCVLSLATSATAADRAPLLQEGKKTLFQRAVSHPDAQLFDGPDASAKAVNPSVKTFTVFYIYGQNGTRTEVGVNSNKVDGWIDTAAITSWPQAITMIFTDRMSRMPVLFFKDHKSLVDTCTSQDLGKRMVSLNEAAQTALKTGTTPADLPILAAEPDASAVSRSRFYLMPVLAVDNQFGEQTRLLQVASIDPGNTATNAKSGASAQGGQNPQNAQQNTAIAFVIDTTISMKPYIERTKVLLRSIYDELEKSPHGDKVAFAVVAYRSSLKKSPKLDYLSKVISDFRTVSNRKELESALANLDEATTSTHAFDEDAMAGLKTAVDQLTWDKYNARVMLLLTDAGFLPGTDAESSTGLDAKEMADYMRTNNIWFTVAHIKTPLGAKNFVGAQRDYRDLARLDDNSASYITIDASTPAKGAEMFAQVGDTLAAGYRAMVEATATGKILVKPEDVAAAEDPAKRAQQIAERTGYAMQLDFIGQRDGNRAPGVMSAWIADADLEKLARSTQEAPVRAAYPAVLLTKFQLSDLSDRLKAIIDSAERTKRTDSKDFFEGILSASAQMSRDPAGFSRKPGQNLSESGALGEYLEGLPYKSDVLLMKESDWYSMSTGQQTAFINRLKSRLARYEQYDKDRANWESFGASNPGDWVYRVPLDMLP